MWEELFTADIRFLSSHLFNRKSWQQLFFFSNFTPNNPQLFPIRMVTYYHKYLIPLIPVRLAESQLDAQASLCVIHRFHLIAIISFNHREKTTI